MAVRNDFELYNRPLWVNEHEKFSVYMKSLHWVQTTTARSLHCKVLSAFQNDTEQPQMNCMSSTSVQHNKLNAKILPLNLNHTREDSEYQLLNWRIYIKLSTDFVAFTKFIHVWYHHGNFTCKTFLMLWPSFRLQVKVEIQAFSRPFTKKKPVK